MYHGDRCGGAAGIRGERRYPPTHGSLFDGGNRFDHLMARLFIAVRPPRDVIERIHDLPRPEESGVRWVPLGQWHITLRFLADADPADACAAFARIDARPADVMLGPRVSRLGRNVVCLPAAGADDLASAAADATADLGASPDPRPFHGHLTLARLKHRAACRLTGAPFTAAFAVRELELVQSTLSSTGAVHEVIARHPVEPPPAP